MDAYVSQLPLLTPRDKRGVLNLVAKTIDLGVRRPTEFSSVAALSGVKIFRSVPRQSWLESRKRIYRVCGMGEVPGASAETTFELLCNLQLIPEWDMLFKGAKYLNFASSADGAVEVGHLHIVYGLPGVSRIISDRDFVIRVARVRFPNGIRVLHCHSVSPDEQMEGDPGPSPRMIRGYMWDSGYTVVPTRIGCCLNITLQVDPKGWVPTSITNLSLEATSLNIQRIRAALQRLPCRVLEQLPHLNREQGEDSKPLQCDAPPTGGTDKPERLKRARMAMAT